jgi:starch phosphorylase
MKKIKILPYTVVPTLPERLAPLKDLAGNVWFSWNPAAIRLFRQMHMDLWEETGHNPVKLLGEIGQDRIAELVEDEGFLDQMDRVVRAFERYRAATGAYSFHLDRPADYKVAYLSAEYGLTECLPLYSGGLGILSGDHLKSASDLNIPLIAVGLLYQEGYFRQVLNSEGWQTERYPDNDFHTMPIEQIMDEKGAPISIEVPMENRVITIHIWKIQVGRVPLYLLDTNVPTNSAADRAITGKLYGGDREMRLQQEIVLGIGGVRALGRLGLRPAVFHMNEGHSAFAVLERIRGLMAKRGLSFETAAEFVKASSIFTTHTPVPAGNDVFTSDLMQRYFGAMMGELGLESQQFLGLGRQNPNDRNEPFCMTVLALKYAAWANGVSEIHARVARTMWTALWPDLPHAETPIKGLTNGIHIPSWISNEMAGLFDRYLGPRWTEDPDNEKVWAKTMAIPDTELWTTHARRRERLVAFTRRRVTAQLQRLGSPRSEIEAARGILNPRALTIGFARRFATYKRGNLFFRDLARVERILNSTERPVQIIFAGKAHPADNNGKEYIKAIIEIASDPRFRNRVAFIEDYDIHVARYLVQGVDVWLNNPRRPLEACGTSGMKAAANGALNFSVLDGWWDEAYTPEVGWAIGCGEEFTDEAYADEAESRAIHDLLEKEIVPCFYDRGPDGLPKGWIEKMKNCLKSVSPVFNTHRMVEDYMEMLYHPAAMIALRLKKDEYAGAKELAEWAARLNREWANVRIADVVLEGSGEVRVSGRVGVTARIAAHGLAAGDLQVEAWHGRLNADGEIEKGVAVGLMAHGSESGMLVFAGEIECQTAGRFGTAIRVLPRHDLLANPLHSGIVRWG